MSHEQTTESRCTSKGGGGSVRLQPPLPQNQNLKENIGFVDRMILNISGDLLFSWNHPLKTADDYFCK